MPREARTDLGRGVRGAPRLARREVDRLEVLLRPPRLDDFTGWRRARLGSQADIEPHWVASTLTWEERHRYRLWVREVLDGRRAARRGDAVAWVVDVDGRVRGQVSLTDVDRATGSAELGLWVDSGTSGLGVGTAATSSVVQHAFTTLGLHRVVALVAEDNTAMRHVVEAVGFVDEAVLRDYLEVGDGLRDHRLWSIHRDDRAAATLLHDAQPTGRVDVSVDDEGVLLEATPDPGMARTALEVARYAASATRSARAGRRVPTVQTPWLRCPEATGPRVSLRPVPGASAWELLVDERPAGALTLHRHATWNRSVGLHVSRQAREAGAVALTAALRAVTDHAASALDVRRTWTMLPAPSPGALVVALADSGFGHEGDLRTSTRGQHDELWARVGR